MPTSYVNIVVASNLITQCQLNNKKQTDLIRLFLGLILVLPSKTISHYPGEMTVFFTFFSMKVLFLAWLLSHVFFNWLILFLVY